MKNFYAFFYSCHKTTSDGNHSHYSGADGVHIKIFNPDGSEYKIDETNIFMINIDFYKTLVSKGKAKYANIDEELDSNIKKDLLNILEKASESLNDSYSNLNFKKYLFIGTIDDEDIASYKSNIEFSILQDKKSLNYRI